MVALGSQTQPEYIPAELLEILPMQTFKGKLDMVEEAIRLPDMNRDMIDDQGKELLAVNSIEGPVRIARVSRSRLTVSRQHVSTDSQSKKTCSMLMLADSMVHK